MTTSTEPVTAAIERGDAGWLTAHVDGTACPPALVARLARHADPRLRLLAVRWLGERLTGDPGAVPADEVTRLLPADPGDPAGTPEVALAAAELFQRSGQHLPAGAWPRWRDAAPPAVVRVAWLRAEILHLPGRLTGEPCGEPLYQAVAGLRCAGAPDPGRLIDELAGRDDPVLRAAALRLCREALHAAVLAPAPARRVLIRLLDGTDPAVVAGALTELAQPWAAVDPAAPPRLRTLLAGGGSAAVVEAGVAGSGSAAVVETAVAVGGSAAVVEAAVAAAARHGLRDALLDAAADAALPPRARRRALEALGDLLDRAHIPAVVALAAGDPLLLGPPAVACLVAMHHRGLFPAADDAAGVVGLALADHTIPVDDVAMLLYTARHRVRDALLDAAPADPGWPRRLALLVALARQGAPDLDIGADLAGLLPVVATPEPVLAAIRALRHAPAEDAVLAALPRAPAAALHALEAVGAARTVAALTGALEGEGTPYLRPWRIQALELCWRLVEPDRRHALLRRLDPATLPGPIAVDLGRPDERELAVLRAGTSPDRPVEALTRLARDADTGTVPAVTEVLGRIVAELAIAWDTRGNPPGQRHTAPAELAAAAADADRPASATQPMPVVPQRAVDAIHGLGRRLRRSGRIRPVCLLDAATDQAAGHALVASVALDLLDRPRSTPTELAMLLELLHRAPYDGTRARVHRLLRHRDPHVRKHTIALLARDGGGAEALSATLTALTAAADVQTARQALAALGQVGARWAGHAVAACLEHPNMNVKKAAAEALRTAGTPGTVPHLLAWLGRHDNPGLRAALTSALRAILGDAADATVLAAAEHAEPGRTRDLLLTALDGALPARSVAALADQGSPAGPALLRLVATGRVRLQAGTVAELADRMVAHGVTPPTASPTAGPHPDLVALTRNGWHDTTARRVATGHDPADLPAALLPGLRRLLPDWLRLATTGPAIRPPVLRLVLRCCPAPWTDAERAAFTRSWQALVTGVGELSHSDRDGLLAVLEDLAPHLTGAAAFDVTSALRRVRPTPAGRRSPLTVLRRCGAVLTRADVERALADAALGADPWQGEVRVLREAFAVPAPPRPPAASPGSSAASPGSSAALPGSLAALPGLSAASPGSPAASPRSPAAVSSGSSAGVSPGPSAAGPARSPAAAARTGSREQLAALIEAWPDTPPGERPALLDRMVALQPIDAPQWTIGEEADRHDPAPRAPHDGDLDQPRSAAQRDRLLEMFEHPAPGTTQRRQAAEALRDWPEPDIRRRLLTAHLRGDATVPPTAALARDLTPADLTAAAFPAAVLAADAPTAAALSAADLAAAAFPAAVFTDDTSTHGASTDAALSDGALPAAVSTGDEGGGDRSGDAMLIRAIRLAGHLLSADLPPLVLALRRLREHANPAIRTAADEVLRRLPVHVRAAVIGAPLEPLLVRAPVEPRLPAGLLERPVPPAGARPPTRQDLLDRARDGDAAQIRVALASLAETTGDGDTDVADLLEHLLRHPEPKVRLHAHRVSRQLLDRPVYLRHSEILLADPQPDIVRSAIRAVSGGAWTPAIGAVVGLLLHPDPTVRRTAEAGLARFGPVAAPAVTKAAGRARPDRRGVYTTVLAGLAAAADPPA
ncbi:HEAT repeat domain-containing protein [Dactylosporangium sp. NPDC049525]|uniref:HEAT repeat domain-containing protein n=1 Tax=Dactylosporangium sp. NPDC049525 TaxID=3154730 RepID=UPI00341443C4